MHFIIIFHFENHGCPELSLMEVRGYAIKKKSNLKAKLGGVAVGEKSIDCDEDAREME